jgi:hypothetical protein
VSDNPDYKVQKQPAGIGREQFVVYHKGDRIASADSEYQAEIIQVTHELTGRVR